MAKKLIETKRQEIYDHINNTSHDLIKCYDLTQLSVLEWKDAKYIKTDPRFLPVRIDSYIYKRRCWRRGYTKTYVTKWIRLDEIKFIFNKRTGRKLIIQY